MKNSLILIILTCLLFCCTGCRTSADFNYIEDSIRDQIYPAKLDKDVKFSLGSLSMRMINGFIDDEEEADIFLKEIKSVQVGVYKVLDLEKTRSFQIPSDVERSMVKKGWDPFVHVRKRNGENVSLYYRQLSENTASIYAIVMEPDEVVITEINGKLDNILEKAICEHRLAGVNNL
jgi:hypothetical protein